MEKSSENSNESEASFFECNICLEQAKDAVVSKCGHLFCWPCLHQWLETRPNIQTCPVCKSSISRDSVTPIYGRNCTDKKDPRDKVPPRPQGQRTEAPRNNSFSGFGFEGFQVSFGIGSFPFSFFATTFNLGGESSRTPHAPANGSNQHFEEQILNKIFLVIFCFIILMIVLA